MLKDILSEVIIQIQKQQHKDKVHRLYSYLKRTLYQINSGSHRGHDRMVVGFTTTYAIGAYHHLCCEFESSSG